MSRIVHCHLDVRGMILHKDKNLRNLFKRDNGTKLSPSEARNFLLDCLSEGKKALPFGEPCEGFSYITGCPGHEQPTQPETE